jgi:hypothetical protein
MSTYGDLTYGSTYYGGSLDRKAHFAIEVLLNDVWTDITCDVRTGKVARGRTSLLDKFAASTLAIDIADFHDRYNAWNPSGIWAQNGVFRTGVPIRLRVRQFGTLYGLFTGTTDAVNDSWPGTTDALTNVEATDAFKNLARVRPTKLGAPVGAGELSGARVNRILDASGYTGPRVVSPGLSAWQGTILDGVALDLLNEVSEGEFGALFIDADGAVSFQDRNAIASNPRMVNVQWSFLDFDGAPTDRTWTCYSDIQLAATDDQVTNRATVTRTGGAAQVQIDQASIDWYDVRSYTRDNIPLNTDADANQLALNVVQELAYNDRRVDAITFYPLYATNGVEVACGLRVLDRIRVVRVGIGGTAIDAELFIQGIEHTISGGGLGDTAAAWTCTVRTTNAKVVRDAGQWDIAVWDTGKWGV